MAGERPTYGGRELDDRYRLELRSEAKVDDEALVSLWTDEGALTVEEARERVSEVLFVALDEEERPVAVSTVGLLEVTKLHLELWYYRTFVSAEHRTGSLAWVLFYASIGHLRERYTSGEDTRGAGMFMAVQNRGLKSTRDMAMWERSRFAFVGEDIKGAHLRVLYFPGSEAPLPPFSPPAP